MPLSVLGLGQLAKVVGLKGKPDLKKFLASLGFIPGQQVRIMQEVFGNNIVVMMGGTRLAIDRRAAHCVEIIPVQEGLC